MSKIITISVLITLKYSNYNKKNHSTNITKKFFKGYRSNHVSENTFVYLFNKSKF